MRNFTNSQKVAGELAVRNLSLKAYMAYSESDFTVYKYEHDGNEVYAVYLDSEEYLVDATLAQVNELFESMYESEEN